MTGSKRFYVMLFGILTGVFWFGQYVFMPYFTPYMELLGASNLLIGIMVGIYGVAQILIRLPLGIISDKLNNRKLFILLGSAAGIIGSAGLWLSTNLLIIVIMRFFIGVSASCWVCFTVLYGSYYPPGESVKALGKLSAYNYLGQTVGFVVAAYAGSQFGMRSTFLIASFTFVIAFLLSFFVKETKTNTGQSYTMRDIVNVAKNSRNLKIALMGLIFQIMMFATYTGFTPTLATKLGANAIDLSVISFLFAVTSIPSAYLCGSPLWKRFSNRNLLTLTSIVLVACCILQPLCTTMFFLCFLQGIAGFARGAFFSILLGLVIKDTAYEKQAVVMGYFQAVYSIGIIIGPILAGAISQIFSMAVAYFSIGLLSLIIPIISFWGLKNE